MKHFANVTSKVLYYYVEEHGFPKCFFFPPLTYRRRGCIMPSCERTSLQNRWCMAGRAEGDFKADNELLR